jgi:peroxiredoxin family protein
MEILIQVSSGYWDNIVPGLIMASRFKSEGKDVAVRFEWRALIAFAEKRYEYSPLAEKYSDVIEENAKKMGLPIDPMDYLKGAKASGVPVYGCGIEASLAGITDKLPPEIQLISEDITKLFKDAKKIISGF